jgi:dipeptidyl aminopeptidase/acylaminoacyl peptidase
MRAVARSLVVAGVACMASVAQAAPLPAAAFAKHEQFKDPVLSPDGRYLAVISSIEGRRAALVRDLQTAGKYTPVMTAEAGGNFDLTWCRWGNNTRLVCAFRGTAERNDRIFGTVKLAAVDADGKNFKELLRELSEAAGPRNPIIDWTADDPNTVLIQATNREVYPALKELEFTPAVFKLNIVSGELDTLLKTRQEISSYTSDGHGNVRFAVGYDDNRRQTYFGRAQGDDEWHLLSKMGVHKREERFTPLAVVTGTNRAYAFGPSNGRTALWEIDLKDQQAPKLVYEHPQVDLERALYSADGQLVGVTFETDKPDVHYLDERAAATAKAFAKALPNTFNVMSSTSADVKKFVLTARSDMDAGSYFLYDAANPRLAAIGTAYPQLQKQTLPLQAVQFKAQDGTTVPGYLIKQGAEKTPLVVLAHSGFSRTAWNFDYLMQFIASRGDAVLAINYRGSSGYGREWQDAPKQDWGGLPYSDLTDGVRWAVAQGIADPKRVCIVGRGLGGGYAALLGATRDAELFKCAVSIGGRGDLSELYRSSRSTDADNVNVSKLKDDAPLRRPGDFKMPVLLVHGTRDSAVSFENAKNLDDALNKAGKAHKLVKIEGADYSFAREADRTTLLQELEQFLNTQLSGN